MNENDQNDFKVVSYQQKCNSKNTYFIEEYMLAHCSYIDPSYSCLGNIYCN
jgi:hypothetical protein